jgi:hypothetical protein
MKLIEAMQYWRNIIKNVLRYPSQDVRIFKGELSGLIYDRFINTLLFENFMEEYLMDTDIKPTDIDNIIDNTFYFYGDYRYIEHIFDIEIKTDIVLGIIQSWNDIIYEINIEERHRDKLNYIINRNIQKLLKNIKIKNKIKKYKINFLY